MRRFFSLVAMSVLLVMTLAASPDKGTPPAAQKASGKATEAASDRCQAKTKDGDQCKRKAAVGSKFCWQHGGAKKK